MSTDGSPNDGAPQIRFLLIERGLGLCHLSLRLFDLGFGLLYLCPQRFELLLTLVVLFGEPFRTLELGAQLLQTGPGTVGFGLGNLERSFSLTDPFSVLIVAEPNEGLALLDVVAVLGQNGFHSGVNLRGDDDLIAGLNRAAHSLLQGQSSVAGLHGFYGWGRIAFLLR